MEVSHRVVAGMKTYPGLPTSEVDVIVDDEASRERYGGEAEFFSAVLVRTEFSRHWGTDAYFTGHPFLTAHSVDVPVRADRHSSGSIRST